MKSYTDTQSDDERLIRLIAQLSEEALAQLYDRYSHLVFSIAVAIVDDRSTAEDVTLDVFMRVWQRADLYRAERAKVRTWLTHIARHQAIDALRRRSVRPDHQAFSWDVVSPHTVFLTQDPQELAELTLRGERIRAALAQLPDEQKQTLVLAYYGGLTQLEIAEVLDQPLGTIKTRLRLGMQKLHNFLKDEQEPENKSLETVDAYFINRED
jgi:RNA polymerase sigma-70 factor (ECF subfamily)